ncbi:cytochrome p450, partial [Moniliophthora roreri]
VSQFPYTFGQIVSDEPWHVPVVRGALSGSTETGTSETFSGNLLDDFRVDEKVNFAGLGSLQVL